MNHAAESDKHLYFVATSTIHAWNRMKRRIPGHLRAHESAGGVCTSYTSSCQAFLYLLSKVTRQNDPLTVNSTRPTAHADHDENIDVLDCRQPI